MSNKKYDIPYSMKPTKKHKKSKYSKYIDENDTFVTRFLSSPGRKLCAYVTFFTIFACIFLNALRSSKHPDAVAYEIDLNFSGDREKNLIDETISNSKSLNIPDDSQIAEIDEIDEIDILDSDDGELPLSNIKDTKADNNQKKGNSNSKSTQNTVKSNIKNNKNNRKVNNKGDNFDDELSDQISSGNEKLKAAKEKWNKINAMENKRSNVHEIENQKITNEELIDKVDKMEQQREKGRNKNAVKGEERYL